MKKNEILSKLADSLQDEHLDQMSYFKHLLQVEASAEFAEKTAEKWSEIREEEQQSAPAILVRLFPYIAAASIFLLVLSIGSIYYGEQGIDTTSITGLDDLTDEEVEIYVFQNERR